MKVIILPQFFLFLCKIVMILIINNDIVYPYFQLRKANTNYYCIDRQMIAPNRIDSEQIKEFLVHQMLILGLLIFHLNH